MRVSMVFKLCISFVLASFAFGDRSADAGLRHLQSSGLDVDELLFTQYQSNFNAHSTDVIKLTVVDALNSPSVTATSLPLPTNVSCAPGTNFCRITRSHDQLVAHINMRRPHSSSERCSADYRADGIPSIHCMTVPSGVQDMVDTSIIQTGSVYRISSQSGVFRGTSSSSLSNMATVVGDGSNYSTLIELSDGQYVGFRYKTASYKSAIRGNATTAPSSITGGDYTVRVVRDPSRGSNAFISYSHTRGFQNFTFEGESFSDFSNVVNGNHRNIVDFVVSLDGHRVYVVRGTGQIDCISFVNNKVVRIRNPPSIARVRGIGLFPSADPNAITPIPTATASHLPTSSPSSITSSDEATLSASSSSTSTETPSSTSTFSASPTATLSVGASPSAPLTPSPTASGSPTSPSSVSPVVDAIARTSTSATSPLGAVGGVVGGFLVVAIVGLFAYKTVQRRRFKQRKNEISAAVYGPDSYLSTLGINSNGAHPEQTVVYQLQFGRNTGSGINRGYRVT